MKAFFIFFAVVAAGALIVPLAVKLSAKPDDDPVGLKGQTAPALKLKTLDGKDLDLAAMKGKVLLLDAWATWCPPCRASLPHLQQLSADADRAARGLAVWAVNDAEKPSDVSKFVGDNKYTFTVAMDDGSALQACHVEALPSTILIGRDGRVQATFVGYSEGVAQQIDAAVDKALAEK